MKNWQIFPDFLPFHFQRLFKRLVKKPVQEYIKLRRLAKSINGLNDSKQKILDVALDYGFSSYANFTRAFKETYNITPEEYRKNKPMLNTFDKPEISMDYVLIDEEIPLIVGNIVLEIQRKTVTEPEIYLGYETEVKVSTQIPVGEATGIDIPGQLWRRYHSDIEIIAANLIPGIELGMSHTANPMQNTFTYFAGGLVENIPAQINGNFVKQELPAGEYIVCRIEAEKFEELVTVALDQANKYLFNTWLPRHHITTQPFSAEKYYRNSREDDYMEIWVSPISVKYNRRKEN